VKRERFATCLELMSEIRSFKSVIPEALSLVEPTLAPSISFGSRYMISYAY